MLNLPAIRRQFPILDQRIDGQPLIYLDSAATSQKPQAVLDAMDEFYRTKNANAHRGMHVLAERATVAFEDARATVANFIHARQRDEIVFTKNATESLNLIAHSWGRTHLQAGDIVVLTLLEHHANIVPWLQLKAERGIELRWIDIDENGRLRLEQLDAFLKTGKVKLVSVTGQSNVLGVRPDLKTIIQKSHDDGALVCIDAAQQVAHQPIDVRALDCDFLVFSGHKLYGPTGIGVLYAKEELLERMPPFLGGGMMIGEVTTEHFTPADIPARFEAGTQPLAEAVGLAAAIRWLSTFSWQDIEAHERSLIELAMKELRAVEGLHLLAPKNAAEISGCLSFVIDSVHPHDLTEILGRQGICLRAGHHCAQPLHRRLGINASSRVSFGIYNLHAEIIAAIDSIQKATARLT